MTVGLRVPRLRGVVRHFQGVPEPRGGWRRVLWAVATAAVVSAATFAATRAVLPPQHDPPHPGWGWPKADAFPSDLDRTTYLNHLAAGADEWFDRRPTDFAGAAERIRGFRAGCTALPHGGLSPLPPADRAWLKEGCRKWREAFDRHLAALEDTGDPAAVLSATDETVRR